MQELSSGPALSLRHSGFKSGDACLLSLPQPLGRSCFLKPKIAKAAEIKRTQQLRSLAAVPQGRLPQPSALLHHLSPRWFKLAQFTWDRGMVKACAQLQAAELTQSNSKSQAGIDPVTIKPKPFALFELKKTMKVLFQSSQPQATLAFTRTKF